MCHTHEAGDVDSLMRRPTGESEVASAFCDFFDSHQTEPVPSPPVELVAAEQSRSLADEIDLRATDSNRSH
eukprot:139359-Hanusia_phi.AAC.1